MMMMMLTGLVGDPVPGREESESCVCVISIIMSETWSF